MTVQQLTPAQWAALLHQDLPQIPLRFFQAWVTAEASYSTAPGTYNPLNIMIPPGGVGGDPTLAQFQASGAGGGPAYFQNPQQGAQATALFISREYSHLVTTASSPGSTIQDMIDWISSAQWDAGHYVDPAGGNKIANDWHTLFGPTTNVSVSQADAMMGSIDPPPSGAPAPSAPTGDTSPPGGSALGGLGGDFVSGAWNAIAGSPIADWLRRFALIAVILVAGLVVLGALLKQQEEAPA